MRRREFITLLAGAPRRPRQQPPRRGRCHRRRHDRAAVSMLRLIFTRFFMGPR